MKSSHLPALLVLALLHSTASLAQDAPAAASAVTKPVKEKKTCRVLEVTGSIMPNRTCHTAAQWSEIDKQNEASAATLRDRKTNR